MQVAEGLVLNLINGVQGGVRDIHAETVQRAFGVQFQRELIKKITVDRKLPKRPAGQHLALGNGIVQPLHDAVGLIGKLGLDVFGVQGLQQLGGQQPEQPQQKQADEAQKPHQLPADAKGMPCFGGLPHAPHAPSVNGRHRGRTYSRCPIP